MSKLPPIDRRGFLQGSVAAAALVANSASKSQTATPNEAPGRAGSAGQAATPLGLPPLFRVEMDVKDCEIQGKVPDGLNGTFYRVGPDAQYANRQGNIFFDGEGHVSMFRIRNGRVDFKSRYVRNERYVAQEQAGKILFPMYRNPYLDDPTVKGKSRGTHNTHIIHHNGMLLALKEDSPPAALHLDTLETLDPVYTFGGQLPRTMPFTAHPKIDSETGNLVAFGYEAEGHGSDAVRVFEITPQGQKTWDVTVRVPYVGILHDYAVTQRYVMFHVIPMAIDQAQMERGGIHWSWREGLPTYFGYFRRGGDGKDVRWIKGPACGSVHVMGCYDDGKKLIVDMDISEASPYSIMPNHDGSAWDAMKGAGRMHRLSVDLTRKSTARYDIELLYADFLGSLERQDDRYHTVPYRIGFMPARMAPRPGDNDKRDAAHYVRFDHSTRQTQAYQASEGVSLAEASFAPKSRTAREGEGWLMGVASHAREQGRSDLLIFDAEHLNDGPVATVKMPTKIIGQVHGWWVPDWERQAMPAANPITGT